MARFILNKTWLWYSRNKNNSWIGKYNTQINIFDYDNLSVSHKETFISGKWDIKLLESYSSVIKNNYLPNFVYNFIIKDVQTKNRNVHKYICKRQVTE